VRVNLASLKDQAFRQDKSSIIQKAKEPLDQLNRAIEAAVESRLSR